MSGSFRRYEILLPLAFNDGGRVPDPLIAETLSELEQQFGAVSCETQTIRGLWQHEGQVYRDNLVRLFVDVPDLQDSRDFIASFKARLKARFRQLDIWITSYPIDVI